jgi:hypothetical protein
VRGNIQAWLCPTSPLREWHPVSLRAGSSVIFNALRGYHVILWIKGVFPAQRSGPIPIAAKLKSPENRLIFQINLSLFKRQETSFSILTGGPVRIRMTAYCGWSPGANQDNIIFGWSTGADQDNIIFGWSTDTDRDDSILRKSPMYPARQGKHLLPVGR